MPAAKATPEAEPTPLPDGAAAVPAETVEPAPAPVAAATAEEDEAGSIVDGLSASQMQEILIAIAKKQAEAGPDKTIADLVMPDGLKLIVTCPCGASYEGLRPDEHGNPCLGCGNPIP